MLDNYLIGDTSRISPEAPVPVVKIFKEENKIGGAGNVSSNLSRLGVETILIGAIGKDNSGEKITKILNKKEIKHNLIFYKNNRTIKKTRIISRNQQIARLDFEDTEVVFDKKLLISKFKESLNDVDVVIFSDYGKGLLFDIEELITLAKKEQKIIIIDPKGDNFLKYSNANVITPNFNEFEAVVGKCISEKEIIKKALKLIKKINISAILLTRGSKGMTLIQSNKNIVNIPTVAANVYDVTGAGDTVVAFLAASLSLNLKLEEAAKISNKAAGLVVGKLGSSSIGINELFDSYKEKIIFDQSELKIIVDDLKSKNQKIVMTNGCFDILHKGHINYLGKAKTLGDVLIVALNTDDSVRKLKGKNRPINTLDDRAEVLMSLESVDMVTYFSQETPIDLYAEILPDLLVKGGDYKLDDIIGSEEVINNGGEVKIIDFVEGYSSSNIIKKLKD